MDSKFAPELVLEDDERIHLAVVQAQPGFKVIQKIFRSAIDTFVLAMINAPEDSPEAASKHRSAKVAAQLYTEFIDRVSLEVERHVSGARPEITYSDPTEALDMGLTAGSIFDNNEIWS